MRHTIDRLELEFAALAAQFSQTSQWDDEGFNHAADWIRINCHMNNHAVWNALTVGEQMADLPDTVDSMHDGDIGFAHVAAMANTADKVKGFDERELLPLALEHSPGKFFYKCIHYRHARDAKGYADEVEDLHERRSLALSTSQDGCLFINGVLDPVGGAAVRNALEPLARPSGAHDDRTREQRLADGLVERLTVGAPATVQITATVETLMDLAGAAGGEMELSAPVSSASVRRMACDSTIARVLLNPESVTVDVGRSTRIIDGGLRKALKVRDGHCRWPGCERPASWCDGHHVVHWADGGPTDLENLVLLCRRHHRMVHEGGWKLVKVEREIVTVAPTVRFGVDRAATGGRDLWSPASAASGPP